MAPFQMRLRLQISPAHSDEEEEEEEEDEEEEEEEEEETESEGTVSPPMMLRAGRGGGGGLVGAVVGALRRSLVMCSVGAVGDDEEEDSEGEEEGIEIGRPTDVRHVSHVTFDRFGGFLGLPADLEPDVPRPTPSASVSVFGVSPTSMQCSYDQRGNSVPTILLMMQRKLYMREGLKIEGIFRINAENSQEVYVRDQLNSGVVPDEVDLHCLSGLIKAWFRELPAGILDSLTPEQVMHCNTEEECAFLASMLPPVEAALLDWAINLMADVVEHENHNKMNARSIAMVFAPNMTQMADPLTALIHAVQVMNFLQTLILKTLKERKEAAGQVTALQSCSDSPNNQDEPQMTEDLEKPLVFSSPEKPLVFSSQEDVDFPMIDKATSDQFLGAEKVLHHGTQSGSDEPKKCGIDMDHEKSHSDVSPPGSNLNNQINHCGKEFGNRNVEGLFDRFSFRKGVERLCRHPVFQLSRSMKKSEDVVVFDAPRETRQAWV
ncbi:rho GTPase-activating protein 5-like isoform X2 [Phragmites australis]|uniref:rho GTPase-activating protein 5-like isoform X2 n=1 Tax=Phragmites australis TaxID=29695 RepID=UPI002D790E9E|nr:rho GTPase-activating protein 5-like isoform X2 [Phragmites australis]